MWVFRQWRPLTPVDRLTKRFVRLLKGESIYLGKGLFRICGRRKERSDVGLKPFLSVIIKQKLDEKSELRKHEGRSNGKRHLLDVGISFDRKKITPFHGETVLSFSRKIVLGVPVADSQPFDQPVHAR